VDCQGVNRFSLVLPKYRNSFVTSDGDNLAWWVYADTDEPESKLFKMMGAKGEGDENLAHRTDTRMRAELEDLLLPMHDARWRTQSELLEHEARQYEQQLEDEQDERVRAFLTQRIAQIDNDLRLIELWASP
jgi:hypothetical protein